jgi:chemosensory pili system protein ChpA (sensor histidine kinase/response regulator)
MLKRLGVDLQTHVDTIHHAAVEILRESPEPQTLAAGKRAIEVVIEHGSYSTQTQAVVDVAKLTEEAFEIVEGHSALDKMRSGHYVATIVADLSRTIDAIDSGNDPTPFVSHARSLLGSIPRPDAQELVEIDLNDRTQLLRLMERGASESVNPAPTDSPVDLSEIDRELATLGKHGERLLELGEDFETIDGLVRSLVSMQELAARMQVEHIGRVVACALRVVESHRAAGEPLPLDALEFITACRRILPIILENIDDPGRIAHAVDALVDQSAFVLLELRRGTSPLTNYWPEPEAEEYQAITNGQEPPPPAFGTSTKRAGEVTKTTPEWTVGEYRPESSALTGPGPGTAAIGQGESEIRVPVEHIEQLIELTGELAVRSGGYNQRSRRVLSVTQDMNSIADRLRYLIRAWQDGKYQASQVEQLLTEISADLVLASSDLEHVRNDYLSVSGRQTEVRGRLEETISALRSMPLKLITDPLEESFRELSTSFRKQATLRVEGSSNVIDAIHAEQITEMFRKLIVNALEHGIEPPHVRREAGKAPAGLIRIRARRDGSQTVIQVIDDGAGMSESTILDRAEASGYPIPRRDMTRGRVLQYIFLPGFTTKITKPGVEAGMGLDFVSEVVSRMGGSITVQSELGQGTAFTIRLPVALMTLPATILAISTERYALPAAKITSIPLEQVREINEITDGYRAIVGNETVNAADLGAILGLRSHHHVQSDRGEFVMVQCDSEKWLLRVDRMLENESITMQPAGREHVHLNGVVGVSRLQSGEDALVLDIIQILDASSGRSRRFSRQTASLSRVPFALVSDDSISNRRQITGHLEQSGWRVVEARDAYEARELLESVSPELLVVDLDLPAHGGFQIVQSSRNQSPTPIIIGLTGRNEADIRDRIQSFRIDECVSKPLDLDQLDDALESVTRSLHSTE